MKDVKMEKPTQQELEEAAQRAKEWEEFLSQYTVGNNTNKQKTKEKMCLCGKNTATVIHSTKGHCCTECANQK
jgi:hypothetical protein